MSTVEVKTTDLIGPALDWSVAQVEGIKTIMLSPRKDEARKPFALFGSLALSVGGDDQSSYAPSTCWHCGGPLLHEYAAEFEWITDATIKAFTMIDSGVGFGGTHLVALCRAIVQAKLGETVQIPAELA